MKMTGKIILLSAAVAVGASALTAAAFSAMTPQSGVPVADSFISQTDVHSRNGITPVSSLPDATTDFTYASERSIEGVVSIKSYVNSRQRSYQGRGSGSNDPLFEYFFGSPQRSPRRETPAPSDDDGVQTGLGSGVIISPDGYIVTNNHVINGADRLEVTLHDNRTFNATVIGNDEATDLALLKIDPDGTDLTVITFGNSDALRVGEWVLAVGNPFGFTSTVTTGIVSAKARSIQGQSPSYGRRMGIESYIQTDAAVNPGNSGGALVNLSGELVGINTAIYSQTGNYAGYSFAIPVSIVRKVVTDIKQYGEVQRAVLGIVFGELNPKLAREHNITAVNDGIYIGEIVAGGAADRAGLQVGDVITAIGDAPTHNTAQLQEQISRLRPGDTVKITYIRDNKTNTVNVTLRNSQGTTRLAAASPAKSLGCTFSAVPAEVRRSLNLRGGIQVSDLKAGPFKESGIRNTFIILDINNSRVSTSDDVERIYRTILANDEYDHVMFISGVYPDGRKAYYAVPISETED